MIGNQDADQSVDAKQIKFKLSLTVRMPHLAQELELGRPKRVLLRKGQMCLEESALIHRVGRTDYENVPLIDIVVVNQAGREAFHGILFEFWAEARG